jgi:hypothetical protein
MSKIQLTPAQKSEQQAARLKNVRISHKKASEFGVTLDLSAFLGQTLSESDQAKPNGEGIIKSYTLASTGGFINLQAPGFEDVQISVNVITSKAKYDAKIAEKLAKEAQLQVLSEVRAQSSAPAPAPMDQTALMMQMMQQMQAMQAKIEELSMPKTRKKSAPVQTELTV